jgi:hypothetical protein
MAECTSSTLNPRDELLTMSRKHIAEEACHHGYGACWGYVPELRGLRAFVAGWASALCPRSTRGA